MTRLFLILLLILTGCAQIDPIQTQAIAVIADTADRGLADSELFMCRGTTIGAWERRFGQDQEQAQAWKTLCHPSVKATP